MILPWFESEISDESDNEVSLLGVDMSMRSAASNKLWRSEKHSSAKPTLTRVFKLVFHNKQTVTI